MTKEEIQALIDAKIAGQGSAVDVGGALPAILSEILELATTPPVVRPELSVVLEEQTFDAVELDNPAAVNAPYIVDAYGDFFARIPDDAGNSLFGVATGYGLTKVCAYFGNEIYMENDAEHGPLYGGGSFYIVGRKNDNKLYYGYLEI